MSAFNPLFPEKRKWQNQKGIKEDGALVYRCFGRLHKSGAPAVVRNSVAARIKGEPLEEYYQQGQLHRLDGPARIWPEGIPLPDMRLFQRLPENTYLPDALVLLGYLKEEWYDTGLRHRLDGPAIVSFGEEQYWQGGKRHRADGPAIVRSKDLAYLLPRHFSLAGPALSLEEYWEAGILLYRRLHNGTQQWFNKKGDLDRSRGPAIMRTKKFAKSPEAEALGENALWEYRRDGLLHREDGPAIASLEENGLVYRFFKKDILSREGGPAEISKDKKSWHKEGLLHRSDGPAVICGSYKEWRKEGLLHRSDGPAIQDRQKEIYYFEGKRHRPDGPAYITAYFHEWYEEDFLHRSRGPAVWREPVWSEKHGLACREYWQRGQLHREDGPACLYRDGSFFYYQNGQLHRSGGPAVFRKEERAKKDSRPVFEYWQDGQLHRLDGPARIWPGGKEEYWREGICYSSKEALDQYFLLDDIVT